MAQCKAKSKRSGERCRRYAMNGREVCYMHGGKTPVGLALPQTKTGLYSRYLPAKLSTEYEALLNLGNDLFRIDNETATLTTLIQTQLSKIESGESGAAWRSLQETYKAMAIIGQKKNKSPDDMDLFNALFSQMGDIINNGSMAYAARNEATELIERKRRLVADERKDQQAKYQAMSFDRVLLLLTATIACFKESLEKHLDNSKSRQLILSDTQSFLDKVITVDK